MCQIDFKLQLKPYHHIYSDQIQKSNLKTISLNLNFYSLNFPIFQSTCQIALETCRDDTSCQATLHGILLHCELYRCNRNACMDSLQKFYKTLYDDLSLDIAFCICR